MDHQFYMSLALKEARKAYDKGEAPVGAVVVKGESFISQAHNQREKKNSVIAHAEMLALHKAGQKLKSWRLEGCAIYVTLEPCMMCIGAILQSRIKHLIYGCDDAKAGAIKTLKPFGLKNKIQIESGILSEESSKLLKTFFKNLRKKPSIY